MWRIPGPNLGRACDDSETVRPCCSQGSTRMVEAIRSIAQCDSRRTFKPSQIFKTQRPHQDTLTCGRSLAFHPTGTQRRSDRRNQLRCWCCRCPGSRRSGWDLVPSLRTEARKARTLMQKTNTMIEWRLKALLLYSDASTRGTTRTTETAECKCHADTRTSTILT